MNNLKKEKMEGQVLVETYPKAASIIKDSIINNIKKSMRINDDQLGRDFIKDIIDNLDNPKYPRASAMIMSREKSNEQK